MAATITVNSVAVPGDRHFAIADVTFDSSYPTGGYAVTPATFGLTSSIDFLVANDAAGYNVRFDNVNSKIMLYDTGASSGAVLAETASTTDVHTVTTRVLAFGK